MRILRMWLALALLGLGPAAAAPLPNHAGGLPPRSRLPAVRAAAPPRIDGDLDDACWAGATRFTEFTLRELQQPLEFPTTGYLCYDDAYVYAAVRCDDPEPGRILAQETKRNGRLSHDDVVEICIDPRHEFQDYYYFAINPLGTQFESIPGGAGTNITWRGDWRGAAKRTPTGWAAEFAIPWRVLHPQRGTKAVGVFIVRKVGRMGDYSFSPNVGPRWDPRLMADWVGLDMPEVSQPPVFLAYQQVATRGGTQVGAAGLDIKQETTRRANWLLSFNPDFSSIESAVESVDFSYTERYIPDYRPFFTEGRGYFPADQVFYSPRVSEMELGAKAYSPGVGRLGYAALATSGGSEQANAATALSYRFSDAPNRRVWLNSVFHHQPGIDNQVLGGGGSLEWIGMGGRTYWSGSYLASQTHGAAGNGGVMRSDVSYQADPGRLSYGLGFNRIDPGFSPMLGYVPDKDFRSVTGWASYGRRYASGPFERYTLDFDAGSSDHLDGVHFTDVREGGGLLEFRSGYQVQLRGSESYRNPYHDNSVSLRLGWNRRSLNRRGKTQYAIGHSDGGVRRSLMFDQAFRPWRDVGLRFTLEHARVTYPPGRGKANYERAQAVIALNYDISPQRSLGGRLVLSAPSIGTFYGHGSQQNFYLTYRQAVRRGVDAYAILGDPSATRWTTRFALKLVTPF